MRIAIVHTALSPDSAADEQDVLVQVEAVAGAMKTLGHETVVRDCGLDLDKVRTELERTRPHCVFNLVESIWGSGRLIAHLPALLDAMGLPYTGAGAEPLYLTSNKLLAKWWLHAAGLPTPPWVGLLPDNGGEPVFQGPAQITPDNPWIVKSVWEHASIGLDETSLVSGGDLKRLSSCLRQKAPSLGGSSFAEAFIDGREFNLSLLEGPAGVRALPPAEILFNGYGRDKARIVDYRAKWEPGSFEYAHTARTFCFDATDRELLQELKKLALACWRLFGLKGYARVDFRVDRKGRPWILEINANPCLAPDAGFAAALEQADIGFDQALMQIVAAALPDAGEKG